MEVDLYLLFYPNSDWGVFTKFTCPDPAPFPKWMYRKYTFDDNQYSYERIFNALVEVKDKLVENKVVPSKDLEEKIFPKLEDLLKN